MFRTILFIVVFGLGFVSGGLLPSFSLQYHQRLQAQYDQVDMDLAPFQGIAVSFHDGSMAALVQHHLNSTDPTFHAEGEAIQLMIDSHARLAESKAAAEAPYVDQAVYFYKHMDESVASATLDSFTPTLVTTENAVTFALTIGTLVLLIFWATWSTLSIATKRFMSARHT
jgi:hypothetical protein